MDNYPINIQKLSVLNLKGCENILRDNNGINPDDTLIILKIEKNSENIKEKNIQYEVYHPITKKKLDLSNCTNIELNIPVIFDEECKNLFHELQEYGYDLLDINDQFYQDICSKYKTKNGTDVLLVDRQNDFFNNNLSCQDNCEYSSYSEKSTFLKCECKINNNNITLETF